MFLDNLDTIVVFTSGIMVGVVIGKRFANPTDVLERSKWFWFYIKPENFHLLKKGIVFQSKFGKLLLKALEEVK